jgi:hypothetical protein
MTTQLSFSVDEQLDAPPNLRQPAQTQAQAARVREIETWLPVSWFLPCYFTQKWTHPGRCERNIL